MEARKAGIKRFEERDKGALDRLQILNDEREAFVQRVKKVDKLKLAIEATIA